jgi:uncharacterized protein YtpQ (UPF0354 family)
VGHYEKEIREEIRVNLDTIKKEYKAERLTGEVFSFVQAGKTKGATKQAYQRQQSLAQERSSYVSGLLGFGRDGGRQRPL